MDWTNTINFRKVAAALRVMGGRKIVEPHLADALKSRNHILDDIFSVKKINVEEKKKAVEDTEES